jgi:hypothetical protein
MRAVGLALLATCVVAQLFNGPPSLPVVWTSSGATAFSPSGATAVSTLPNGTAVAYGSADGNLAAFYVPFSTTQVDVPVAPGVAVSFSGSQVLNLTARGPSASSGLSPAIQLLATDGDSFVVVAGGGVTRVVVNASNSTSAFGEEVTGAFVQFDGLNVVKAFTMPGAANDTIVLLMQPDNASAGEGVFHLGFFSIRDYKKIGTWPSPISVTVSPVLTCDETVCFVYGADNATLVAATPSGALTFHQLNGIAAGVSLQLTAASGTVVVSSKFVAQAYSYVVSGATGAVSITASWSKTLGDADSMVSVIAAFSPNSLFVGNEANDDGNQTSRMRVFSLTTGAILDDLSLAASYIPSAIDVAPDYSRIIVYSSMYARVAHVYGASSTPDGPKFASHASLFNTSRLVYNSLGNAFKIQAFPADSTNPPQTTPYALVVDDVTVSDAGRTIVLSLDTGKSIFALDSTVHDTAQSPPANRNLVVVPATPFPVALRLTMTPPANSGDNNKLQLEGFRFGGFPTATVIPPLTSYGAFGVVGMTTEPKTGVSYFMYSASCGGSEANLCWNPFTYLIGDNGWRATIELDLNSTQSTIASFAYDVNGPTHIIILGGVDAAPWNSNASAAYVVSVRLSDGTAEWQQSVAGTTNAAFYHSATNRVVLAAGPSNEAIAVDCGDGTVAASGSWGQHIGANATVQETSGNRVLLMGSTGVAAVDVMTLNVVLQYDLNTIMAAAFFRDGLVTCTSDGVLQVSDNTSTTVDSTALYCVPGTLFVAQGFVWSLAYQQTGPNTFDNSIFLARVNFSETSNGDRTGLGLQAPVETSAIELGLSTGITTQMFQAKVLVDHAQQLGVVVTDSYHMGVNFFGGVDLIEGRVLWYRNDTSYTTKGVRGSQGAENLGQQIVAASRADDGSGLLWSFSEFDGSVQFTLPTDITLDGQSCLVDFLADGTVVASYPLQGYTVKYTSLAVGNVPTPQGFRNPQTTPPFPSNSPAHTVPPKPTDAPETAPPAPPGPDDDDKDTAKVVIIVVCCVVAAALVSIIGFVVYRRRSRRGYDEPEAHNLMV